MFCNKFCFIFAANIMYISVFIYAFMCANILGAIVLKPRMIIWSIVIIINSVLTLQVSTAKPMIADLVK